MSADRHTETASDPPAANASASGYVVLCACCLGVVLFEQMQQGQSSLVGAAIVAIGALGLLTKFRAAPLLLVALVAACQMLHGRFSSGFLGPLVAPEPKPIQVRDLAQAAAVLGFVVGQYRLQGLHRHLFPPDERLLALRRIRAPKSWLPPTLQGTRALGSISPLEQGALMLSLPLWALAALLVWLFVDAERDLLAWDPWAVRLTVVVVLLTPGLLVAAALLRFWRRRRMTADEAEMLLQDALWRETRGEQRWITRWLAWFWIRENQRKEPTP